MKHKLITLVAAVLLSANAVAAADLPSALVDPYLQIQVALASDQFAPIAAHAQAVETAAAALGTDGAALTASAKKLVAAKDIAAARTAYGDVSSALEAYAAKTKSGFGKEVRLAYCPMVNKTWLQKDKEIRNPYYGASMLTCGSFKN